MAKSISDFIKRAKKHITSPKASGAQMHRHSNSSNPPTGVNTVKGESRAQSDYRAAKINAAREAYKARKAGKTTQSAPAPGASTQPRSPSNATAKTPAPKNYPRTTPEEGGGLAPPRKATGYEQGGPTRPRKATGYEQGGPTRPRKSAAPSPKSSSMTLRESFAKQNKGNKRYGPAAGQAGNRPAAQQGGAPSHAENAKLARQVKSRKNPRSRITSGKASTAQAAGKALSTRRKNKKPGQR